MKIFCYIHRLQSDLKLGETSAPRGEKWVKETGSRIFKVHFAFVFWLMNALIWKKVGRGRARVKRQRMGVVSEAKGEKERK